MTVFTFLATPKAKPKAKPACYATLLLRLRINVCDAIYQSYYTH